MPNATPKVVTEPRAPFPYFGGKRNAARLVWDALGDPAHYVEPFCGSCAMLLARPAEHRGRVETVNDADGMLVNVWRAIRNAPDEVAHDCAIPVMECELHARLATTKAHMTPDFLSWIEGDERHFDAHLAANWLYCTCASIGSPWNEDGPWRVVDGHLVKSVKGDAGRGINRELPHLGDAGRGINRKLPHLGDAVRGKDDVVRGYLRALARRLERVRICCGDWRRVCKSDATVYAGTASAAVFLDPPYSISPDLYAQCADVTADVREWCAAHGDDPSLRIALCGYLDDHDALLERGWRKVVGRAGGSGMTKDKQGGKRERIWLSPHCAAVPDLFAAAAPSPRSPDLHG